MKRALTLVLLFASSCVPDGPPPAERGAVGVRTRPTAATRGEPFVTSDGWTVTVDRLALYARIVVIEADQERGEPAEALFLWHATRPAELVVRASPAGPRVVRVHIQGEGLFSSDGVGESFYTNVDVEPDLEARLSRPPDGFGEQPVGPRRRSVGALLALHAKKGERTFSADLAIAGMRADRDHPIDVVANEIRFVELDVSVEQIFADGLDDLADADADGDGRLAGPELAGRTLERLSRSLQGLFVLPR